MRTRSTTPVTETFDGGVRLARSVVVVATLLLILSTATAVSAADYDRPSAADPVSGSNHTSQPRNPNVTVVLAPTASEVSAEAWYVARSEAQANRYEEGTANLTWFETDERLQRAFADRDEGLVEVSNDTFSSERTFESGSEVHVTMRFHWVFDPGPGSETPTSWPTDPFVGNGSSLVLGPTLNEHLANGTVVEVRVPAADWTAERSTVDSYTDGNHGQTRVYWWVVGETDGVPRVVFNDSVGRTETPTAEGGALGPAGGVGLALLAVVLTVLLRSGRD